MNDPLPKVPRRERERLRHRQEILDAARRIVADRGLEGVTVEQVARQAEFAVGSIYRHFSSKEELILELVGEFADGMLDEIAVVVAQPLPFLGRLEQFVRLSLQHQAACQPLFEALLTLPGGLPAPGTEAAARMQAMHLRYLAVLDALIEAGERDGVLLPGARLRHAVALAALLHGYAKVAWMGGLSLPTDPASEVLRSFLDGARARPDGAPAHGDPS